MSTTTSASGISADAKSAAPTEVGVGDHVGDWPSSSAPPDTQMSEETVEVPISNVADLVVDDSLLDVSSPGQHPQRSNSVPVQTKVFTNVVSSFTFGGGSSNAPLITSHHKRGRDGWKSFSQPTMSCTGDVGDLPTPEPGELFHLSQQLPPLAPNKRRLKEQSRTRLLLETGRPYRQVHKDILNLGEQQWEDPSRPFKGLARGHTPDRPEGGSLGYYRDIDENYVPRTVVAARTATTSHTATASRTVTNDIVHDYLSSQQSNDPTPKPSRRAAGAARLHRHPIAHRPVTRSMSSITKVFIDIDNFPSRADLILHRRDAEYVVGELVSEFLCPIIKEKMVCVKVPGIPDTLEFMHCVVSILPPQPLLPKIQYVNGCVCCLPKGEVDLSPQTESSDSDFDSDSDPIPATLAEKVVEADRVWDDIDLTELGEMHFADAHFRYDNNLPFERKFHDVHWMREEKGDFGSSRKWEGLDEVGLPCLSKESSPLQILDCFITKNMWTRMVRQTNLYAKQKDRKDWTPLTVIELQCWVGIAIFMGIKKLPRLSMHWRQDHPIFSNDFISKLMHRDRWLAIMSCLHLVDNNTVITDKEDPRYDKIAKVRWLLEAVCKNFRATKPVDRYLSVDEMMIKCLSRNCPIKQYNKSKPDPHGIKVWALVSATSKYIYALDLYCGAQSGRGQAAAPRPPANLPIEQRSTYKVVMLLMDFVPSGHGHVVTMDNFFSSVKLFHDLLSRRIFATGTIRPGIIGWPSSMKWSKKSKGVRGQLTWRMHASHEMGACVWFDRKPVGVLSTFARPWSENVHVQRREGHQKVLVPTSPSLVSYVKLMRGVDVADQLRGGYSISRKGRRWWKRVYFFIFDSAFCNSWVVAQHLWQDTPREEQPYPTHLDFNIALGNSLVFQWNNLCLSKISLGQNMSITPPRAHAPACDPKLCRQCKECSRRTSWRCIRCKDEPYLCVQGSMPSCYQAWHEKKRFYL